VKARQSCRSAGRGESSAPLRIASLSRCAVSCGPCHSKMALRLWDADGRILGNSNRQPIGSPTKYATFEPWARELWGGLPQADIRFHQEAAVTFAGG
jgi:hypothetical protein